MEFYVNHLLDGIRAFNEDTIVVNWLSQWFFLIRLCKLLVIYWSFEEPFLLEYSFVEVREYVIITDDFNQELNFILFFELFKSACIDFLSDSDLLFELIYALNEERLHVSLCLKDIALERVK